MTALHRELEGSSNSVKRKPRQLSAARIRAANISFRTGFSPKAFGTIFSRRRGGSQDVARLKGSGNRALFIGDHFQMANCHSGRAFAPPIYCFSICSTSAKKSLNAAIPPVRRPAETIFDLIISSEILGFGGIWACAFSTASSNVWPVAVKVFAFFFVFFTVFFAMASSRDPTEFAL
jgi:hypothetical protein